MSTFSAPSVIPLYMGSLELEAPVVSFNDFNTPTRPHPVWAWLVRVGNEAILFDSGAPSIQWCAENNRPLLDATDDELFETLRRHGLAPRDVRTVVLSHLHWDHCGGLGILEKAEIVVQQREMVYAHEPLWAHEGSYRFVQRHHLDREPLLGASPLDGDTTLRPGVQVLAAPGHTPGSQVMVIGSGPSGLILAGDTVSVSRNVNDGPKGQIRPGGVYVDLAEYIDTLDRLAHLPQRIMPGHEPGVVRDREISII